MPLLGSVFTVSKPQPRTSFKMCGAAMFIHDYISYKGFYDYFSYYKASISLNSFAFCLRDHKPKSSLKLVSKQSFV